MFEKVRDIIVDTLSCEADAVTMEATLADDLGADSLDAVELNMALEDALGVSISDEELANMKTVGDIVNTYFQMVNDYPDYTGSITVNIDDTGLGGGVTDRLEEVKAERQMYRMVIVPVNFAGAPPKMGGDVVHYKDMTTYLWAVVRDLLEEQSIALENDNELVAQLSVRKYSVVSSGMLQLERKKEMKERGIKSPDRADAVALACFQQSRVYDKWAEKAEQLVITVNAALAMHASEISIGISTVGHFGAALVATQIIGEAKKAVVIGAKQLHTVETDAIGKEFAEFARNIWTTYKRLDYVYCDYEDSMMIKSIKTASERRGLPPIVRYSVNTELEDRIKLTARLIAQNRLFLTEECHCLEQALSSASWSDSRSVARAESLDAGVLTAFEYTIERYISRFLRSEVSR